MPEHPPADIQQRFIEALGDRAYDLWDVLIKLEDHGASRLRPDEAEDDERLQWARRQGYVIDGRTISDLGIEPGDYVRASNLEAMITHCDAHVDQASLEKELDEQEQFNYQLLSSCEAAREEFLATPHGAALKRLMDACKPTTSEARGFDASAEFSPADRYTLRLLLDEHGNPLPATEERTTMLRAVETLDDLAHRANHGDERAVGFVTRLTGYMEKIGKPIAAGTPLTPPEQEVYEEFRREVTHATAYRHLC